VDDLILTRNYEDHIIQLKQELFFEFKMKDLGLLNYYFGVEVFQHSYRIFISQCKYTSKVLKSFGMIDYRLQVLFHPNGEKF